MLRRISTTALLIAGSLLAAAPAEAKSDRLSDRSARRSVERLIADSNVPKSLFRSYVAADGTPLNVVAARGYRGDCDRLGRHAVICEVGFIASYGPTADHPDGVLLQRREILVRRTAAETRTDVI